MTTDIGKKNVRFAALDPYIDTAIVAPTEREMRNNGHTLIEWGSGNGYPRYILDLYNNVVTLHSVVDGLTDYICGNDVVMDFRDGRPNKAMTAAQLWRHLAFSRAMYKAAAVQVIRNQAGEVDSIWPIDIRYLRTDRERSVYYYSEDFGARYVRRGKMLVYPAFMPDARHDTSILAIWESYDGVYPSPWIAAAVRACETESAIDDYHLNAINNGFAASYFVNFNNGVPDDDVKDEIEKDFNEKFAGGKNAARIGFSWNPNKEAATTFEQLKQEDFGDHYAALAKNTRQQIFTAYRANPNLFGIPTESLGFSQEEYDSAFRLFNRTMVRPQQDILRDALEQIIGAGRVVVSPFSMNTVSDE